jgi:hypothetical protein
MIRWEDRLVGNFSYAEELGATGFLSILKQREVPWLNVTWLNRPQSY